MKKILLLMTAFAFTMAVNDLSAQKKKDKEDVEKELIIEKKNGEITVTVEERRGDSVTKEVYTGQEAKEYLEKHESHNYFHSEGDGEHVIVIERDGEDEMHWVMDHDMDLDLELELNELDEKLEELQEELDKLEKEEIKERLDEIMELKEEALKMKMVHLETISENAFVYGDEDVEVEVEEKDGVMIITTRTGDTEEIQEIKIDSEDGAKRVFVSSNSSKSSIASDFDINVNTYPNPNNGKFTIELDLENKEMAEVRVMDSAGKEVYNRSVKGKGEHKLEVDLKKPAPGMYVIVIEQGDNTMKMKTIVE